MDNTATACVQFHGAPGWWLTGVYGPQEDADKVNFMQEPKDIRNLHACPLMLAGDFNLILDPSDKTNDKINRRMMGHFRRCTTDLDMKELYLNGRRYTWSNERMEATLEKLDRVLVSVEWEALHPTSFLSALSTSTSDNCPHHLVLEANLTRGRRFHFEAYWTKIEGFQEVVRQAWGSQPFIQNPFKRLEAKLRATAKQLSNCSNKYVGSVRQQIRIANEVIL
ncbi:uncharacterized protein [Aegilops tauschii subsp. strangulata]|uniref:uncharacterized protein n=1 Tax=Aegilops tauschii subsp. strangulata TaxID=200361 RepID=UPI003CC84BFE